MRESILPLPILLNKYSTSENSIRANVSTSILISESVFVSVFV
jgi:hypothetical protein